MMLKTKSEEQTTNDKKISLAYMKFAFIDSNNKTNTTQKGGGQVSSLALT